MVTRGRVLICGASFAGLSAAWWMRQLGYEVTVVELAPRLRKGGTPVDIRGEVVEVVRRMGLLEEIAARSLPPRSTEFLDRDGSPMRSVAGEPEGEQGPREEWEIERDALLDLLFDRVKDEVEFVFGDSVAGVEETANGVAVRFVHGAERVFSLLLGCDGTHSAVRRLCFGEESQFVTFLETYFSLTIVHKLLIAEDTTQLLSVPGKTIMLNAYNGKTDIGFSFVSDTEIAYDRRDDAAQKGMILEHFAGGGWRTEELLGEMRECGDFYFDKLCQVRMPRWSRGRVALVGDAGYCPSPAAGMGGSMALLGSAALADALKKHPGDVAAAYAEYDRSLRPVVEEIQENAVNYGMKMFLPRTEEDLQQRNAQLGLRPATV